MHLDGLAAWLARLTVHLYVLIGFDHRLLWAYTYFTFERCAR